MKPEWKTCFRIGVCVFLLYLCIHYWPQASVMLTALFKAAVPLIAGCAVAFVVNILMGRYERFFFAKSNKKVIVSARRPVCLVLAYLTVIALLALVIGLVVPQLVSCVKLIIAVLPGALDKCVNYLQTLEFMPKSIGELLDSIDWKSRLGEIASLLGNGVGGVMGTVIQTVSAVLSGVFSALVSFMFSIYLLLGKEQLSRRCKRVMKHYMRESAYDKSIYVAGVLNDCFRRYIIGQCTEAVILGTLCIIGMLILRLPYATMIGALVAFTALIPIVGAFIGAGVGAFMILTVSPIKAVIFVIFIVLLQQVEGNLIYPRVVGSSIGLPALWVLAAVTLGGGVLGISGMLIAVPITAALWRILRDDLNRPRKEKINETEAG